MTSPRKYCFFAAPAACCGALFSLVTCRSPLRQHGSSSSTGQAPERTVNGIYERGGLRERKAKK
jgi:hypothetical protein